MTIDKLERSMANHASYEPDAVIIDPKALAVDFDDLESVQAYIQHRIQEAALFNWQRLNDAKDDVLLFGTNGASDESLKILGLERTFE